MINGFGLQNLGLLALRTPLFSTLTVLAISLVSVFGITKLQFSGENVDILRDGSQELADYDALLKEFRNFNNDAVVLMQVDNLATVDGIETLRELSFEFQLDDRVESILSIFALVRYDGPEKGWASALPAEFDSDEQVAQSLKELVEYIPSAQSLFSPNLDSAVVVVYTKDEAIADSSVRETMDALLELAQEYESNTVKVSIAGQPAIRSGLIDNIVSDLVVLAPIAFALCAILAFILFRQFPAMVLCALPSSLCVLWFLGAMGLSGIELNFLTNILPVLLIVIVFADTLHLYLKWQKFCEQGLEEKAALIEAVEEIGPACAISSLTTAAALLSLCASGNNGLFELGMVGALAVIGGFVSVIVGLPVAAYWALRAGFKPRRATASNLSRLVKPAMGLLQKRSLVIPAGLVPLSARSLCTQCHRQPFSVD